MVIDRLSPCRCCCSAEGAVEKPTIKNHLARPILGLAAQYPLALPHPVNAVHPTWNSGLVFLSVALAVLAAYTSLKLASRISRANGSRWRWLAGGAVGMGVGIWSMHFIGMLAMSLPIVLSYDPMVTADSLLIAIVTSGFALQVASAKRYSAWRHLAGSLIMGSGIAAMHYSGMAAIRMVPAIHYDGRLVAASLLVAVLASYVALWLYYRARHSEFRALSLPRLGAALGMGVAIAGMHYIGMAAAGFDPGAFCSGGVVIEGGWAVVAISASAVSVLLVTLLTAFFNASLQYTSDRHRKVLAQTETDLHHKATHDALTGLPNRELFMALLQAATAADGRAGGALAVLALDIDRFKVINDAIGHDTGNALLKIVAKHLAGLLRGGDVVARTGGDEFLVLLRGVGSVELVSQIARRLLEGMRRTYEVDGHELCATVSMGASIYPLHALNAEELVSHADEAMYAAKQRGRDRLCLFSAETHVYTAGRLQLEADLRHAVARGELELYYQPQLHIGTGSIVGLESLVRWRHPVQGLVPPGEFISMAEETGQIVAIGAWVLDEACRQLAEWRDTGLPALRVAVNLSALQFQDAGLGAQVREALERRRLPPQLLEIEVTEGAVMGDIEQSARTLGEIRDLGVQIAVDDFGTGYSSLSYLKRLPINRLKIDRSFVSDLGASNESDSIANAIVALARGLRLQVIAEGVETLEQLECLRKLGCDEYQGFFCSRALPAAEIPAFVRNWEAASKAPSKPSAPVDAPLAQAV